MARKLPADHRVVAQATAIDSFQLLARQSQDAEGELQVKLLQTLFDVLVLHGLNFGAERGFGVSPLQIIVWYMTHISALRAARCHTWILAEQSRA